MLLLLPWLERFKEHDRRILSVGKFYRAYLKLPVFGTEKILLTVVEYRRSNFLVLESADAVTRQRIEIWAKPYENRTILQTTIYLQKTSAVYHYTIGLVMRNYMKGHLEKSSLIVAEIYKAVEKRRSVINN